MIEVNNIYRVLEIFYDAGAFYLWVGICNLMM